MSYAKNKGSRFEKEVVEYLNKNLIEAKFKKIPGSGAIGTVINEPFLKGDITGTVFGVPKKLKGECKAGYGGEKQLTIKKEWLNKIIEEASQDYALPFLTGKFSGARAKDGVQIFTILDIDTFVYLLNLVTTLQKELDEFYKEKTWA